MGGALAAASEDLYRKPQDAAAANQHCVISHLLRGASLARGHDPERSRHDGAALVHSALGAHGQHIDDPASLR